MRKQAHKTQRAFQTGDNASFLVKPPDGNFVDSYGNKKYNVGIYIRLSRESTRYKNDPSLSIKNQEMLLTKYVEEMPGWAKVKTYIDDGASGAHFNRPAFQEMMTDVRRGLINLVLVKDLSRFGRNYLEAGRYLEDELPALGCRFVALSDDIDTGNDENEKNNEINDNDENDESGVAFKNRNTHGIKKNHEKMNNENDLIPLLNIMNDLYLKNISDRVKTVLAAKAKDGQKISGIAPYGYQRDTIKNTRLIIDSYAAEVVKRIFQTRAEGLSYTRIASILNGENILSPRAYYALRSGRFGRSKQPERLARSKQPERPARSKQPEQPERSARTADNSGSIDTNDTASIVKTTDITDTIDTTVTTDTTDTTGITKWSRRTVKLILHNEIYIGETVSFKRKTRSYRNRRVVKNDEQKWLRIPNTHPPIIDLSLWEAVQRINDKAEARFTYPHKPQNSPFTGRIICADCHSPMAYAANTTTGKDGQIVSYGAYHCRTYAESGGSFCTRHTISVRHLRALILTQIVALIEFIAKQPCKQCEPLQESPFYLAAEDMHGDLCREKCGDTYIDFCMGLINNIEVSEKRTSQGIKTQELRIFYRTTASS